MLRLGLVASTPIGEAYARALSQLPAAELAAVAAVSSRCGPAVRAGASTRPADLVALPSLEAVVLASGLAEPYPLIRRALIHGKHVLAAGPFALTIDQVRRLAALAERRGRLLMFAEERTLSPSFALLADMIRGATRPCLHYIRLLDVRPRQAEAAPDAAAVAAEDLALCARLVERRPRSVSAVAGGPAGGSLEAAFVTLVYPGGLVASLQVSVSESWEARQLVASMAGRTLMLDELDYRTPLRVVSASEWTRRDAAGAERCGRAAWRTNSLALPAEPVDPTLEQCRRFVEAVAGGRAGAADGELWSQVARLWEAAERSMALAGAPVPLETRPRLQELKGQTPHLHVIRGRARRGHSISPRPALTLVSA